MKIAALIFDRIMILASIGPTELLSWVTGTEIVANSLADARVGM
jgi:hypothetical protein